MDEAPAIQTVTHIIVQAIHVRASDIHIESCESKLRIRYRLDGMLKDILSVLPEAAPAVIARIKVLAKLDIAERRIPQDGKFTMQSAQGSIDLRVATFPAIHGEKVVIRLLDRTAHTRSLEDLGCQEQTLYDIRSIMNRAHGFFIVTGPTGSGKTTTLYALLIHLGSSQKNIITIEDPIEYTITGTTQGQVHPEIGFDFSQAIRAILRQDPDIILVGEMRDRQTVQAAVQAALTGHLVLSTLHTADSVGAIIRLIDMGVPAFLINATLTGVLTQRLARLLCNHCKYESELTEQEMLYFNNMGITAAKSFRADGCGNCSGTGYHGRIGIFELLHCTHELRALIHDQVLYNTIAEQAHKQGMRTLLMDAVDKMNGGYTSASEIMRVLA